MMRAATGLILSYYTYITFPLGATLGKGLRIITLPAKGKVELVLASEFYYLPVHGMGNQIPYIQKYL